MKAYWNRKAFSTSEKGLTVLVAIMLSLSAAVGIDSYSHAKSSSLPISVPNFHVGLMVTLRNADNSINTSRYLPNDLILNNFENFMQAWFQGTTANTATTASLTDDGGTARTPTIWSITSASNNYFNFINSNTVGAEIGIGTSSTAPARTDHALTAKTLSYVFVGGSGYDTTTQNVTISAAFTATGSVTITEAGLFTHWDYTGTTFADFMMFHDTFTGIAMTNTQTLTVQYIVPLQSTGFNNNFGYLFASIFSSCATITCSMTTINSNFNLVDIQGITRNPNIYQTGSSANPWTVASTAGINGYVASMAFATGLSGVQGSDTVFQLFQPTFASGNPLYSAVTNTLSSNVLTIKGTLTQTTTQIYQESGLYQENYPAASANNGNYFILIWRGIYSSFTVSANNAFTEAVSLTF